MYKKIIWIVVIAFFSIVVFSCSKNTYETSDEVLRHVLNISFDVPFSIHKNTTAFNGDLSKRMEKRYKLYKPYLGKEARQNFQENETHWLYINEMIDHQFSMNILNLEIINTSSSDETMAYDFTVQVKVDFESDSDAMILLQYGSATLNKSFGKWVIEDYSYTNNLFLDVMYD